MTEKEKEQLAQIIEYYRPDLQIRVAVEEMAELIQALMKQQRNVYEAEEPSRNYDHILEEMADVEIMLEQLKMIFVTSEYSYDAIIQSKIYRQLERMKR